MERLLQDGDEKTDVETDGGIMRNVQMWTGL
jgi:hypothetical protein